MPGDDDWCLSSKYSNDDTKFEPFWYTSKKGARPKIFSHFGDFVIVVNVQFYDFIPS